MRRVNDIVNEIEMKRRSQCRARPNRTLASELAMKNKWENCENGGEPEIPKNRNAGVFFFEMSKVPGVFEQDGGTEREAGEQIERRSEERRVGKEGRARWHGKDEKK